MDVKNNILARITEPSNDDYDNDGSDNCDHNFGTVDDFGVNKTENLSKDALDKIKNYWNCDQTEQGNNLNRSDQTL